MTRLVTIATAAAISLFVCRAGDAFADAQGPKPAASKDYDDDDDAEPEEIEEEWQQPGPDLLVGASFFTRYELRDNYLQAGLVGRRLGENDGIAYRARLELRTSVIDLGNGFDVELTFSPAAIGFMGDVSGGPAAANLGVYEAKMTIFRRALSLEVGRFEMRYGEDRIIGNLDWNEGGRAFDGIRVHTPLRERGSFVDVFATQTQEGSGIGAGTLVGGGDVYFGGVYAGLGALIKEGLTLDIYGLTQIAPETASGPTAHDYEAIEVTLGTRVKRTFGTVTAGVEAGAQFGKRAVADESVLAFQVDAQVGVQVHEKANVGVIGFYASGDDPTSDDIESWNELYPTTHKFMGTMDVIGQRTNVAGAAVTSKIKIAKKFKLGIDGHLFFRPETAAGVDGYTGFEIDAALLWKLAKGLGLRGQYSILLPNEDGPLGSDSEIHYVEMQLRLDV